ncbi:MAG: amidohydrolase family protein [Wenzhouxiangellaceae bacterium]
MTIFRRKLLGAGLLALLLVTLDAHAATLLRGATVHDGNGGVLEDASIRIEDDRITCIGSRIQCLGLPDDEIVELGGRFITPGLVDAHVHFSQTGWLDGRPHWPFVQEFYDYEKLQQGLRQDPDRWHRAYLCSGITAVYDVGGLPWTTAMNNTGDSTHARAHVRAAGPLITHARVEDLVANGNNTFLPMSTDDEALASVARLVEWGSDAVKVWYLDPPADRRDELDRRLMRIGEAARERGLPLIVHATELRNAKMALRAGAAVLVHSVEDSIVDREFIALARANDVVYMPTLLVGANWRRARASVGLGVVHPIDDPNGCVDARTRQVIGHAPVLHDAAPASWRDVDAVFGSLEQSGRDLSVMQRNLVRVMEAGITIATATDAGNPLTLHGPSIYAEMEAMQAAGIQPAKIIVMSTRNGARAMGLGDDIGTLEAGKIADLVILERDPADSAEAFRSITQVMRAGVLRDVSAFASRP